MRSGRKPSLTEDAVRALRRRLADRRSAGERSRWLKDEARRLGASHHAVKQAVLGKSYRWVE